MRFYNNQFGAQTTQLCIKRTNYQLDRLPLNILSTDNWISLSFVDLQ